MRVFDFFAFCSLPSGLCFRDFAILPASQNLDNAMSLRMIYRSGASAPGTSPDTLAGVAELADALA